MKEALKEAERKEAEDEELWRRLDELEVREALEREWEMEEDEEEEVADHDVHSGMCIFPYFQQREGGSKVMQEGIEEIRKEEQK